MEYLKKAQQESGQIQPKEVRDTVEEILADIKANGDAAVKKYEERFGNSSRPLRVSEEEIEERIQRLSPEVRDMIDVVVDRVTAFAKAQLDCIKPLEKQFDDGIVMGHRIVPIEKVGAYVPGGRFPLLSSGPMVVVPAKVAGASQIVACSPANDQGGIHPAVLYGLVKSGATEIYAIGGAQAIGAMAYGTETIPQVDVIAGPGNRFVAEAKRQVYGQVGIDLIAGPSEVLVFADGASDPYKCAADLLAQAEHDPNARAVMVSTSRKTAEQTILMVQEILEQFSENSPAHDSWEKNGEVVVSDSLDEGIRTCDEYAIEHLHIHVKNGKEIMSKLKNYGSLFIGEDSSVVFSDKVSGTNHTLPTLRAARYTGGLWVGSYVKIITHQEITGHGVQYLARHASKQSEIEGLEAHRLSAAIRLK